MSHMSVKIIMLDDVYEIRNRKEKELKYYTEQLEKLKEKMYYVQAEIKLTTTIIDIIEGENVLDLKEYIRDKRKINGNI